MDPAISVLLEVTSLLDQLEIRYVLVGSLASSIHGLYRSTADIDILADVKSAQVLPLLEKMQSSFYVDEKTMREAVTEQRSFNAIHLDSVFKVDIFIPKHDEFAQAQLGRRQLRKLPESESEVYIATAEDTILAKLKWYRAGNEISTSQWNDVLGILGSNQGIDLDYLRLWADKLGLNDLLTRALNDVS